MGQYRGLGPKRRGRKSESKRYDEPLPLGDTSLRKREGRRRWSWIKKSRDASSPRSRIVPEIEKLRRKSVELRWLKALEMANPLFRWMSFAPGPEPDWYSEQIEWTEFSPFEPPEYQVPPGYQPPEYPSPGPLVLPEYAAPEFSDLSDTPNLSKPPKLLTVTTLTFPDLPSGPKPSEVEIPRLNDPEFSDPFRANFSDTDLLGLTPFDPYAGEELTFNWPNPDQWPPFTSPWAYQPYLTKVLGPRLNDIIASGVHLPAWEFPNEDFPQLPIMVFQVPIPTMGVPDDSGGTAGSDIPTLRFTQLCESSERATISVLCEGDIQPAVFTTDSTPVEITSDHIWKRYHHIRVYKRQFYNYGKARGEIEAFGPITEFINWTYYAGEIKWTKTESYSATLAAYPEASQIIKDEPVPKGWDCYTKPIVLRNTEFLTIIKTAAGDTGPGVPQKFWGAEGSNQVKVIREYPPEYWPTEPTPPVPAVMFEGDPNTVVIKKWLVTQTSGENDSVQKWVVRTYAKNSTVARLSDDGYWWLDDGNRPAPFANEIRYMSWLEVRAHLVALNHPLAPYIDQDWDSIPVGFEKVPLPFGLSGYSGMTPPGYSSPPAGMVFPDIPPELHEASSYGGMLGSRLNIPGNGWNNRLRLGTPALATLPNELAWGPMPPSLDVGVVKALGYWKSERGVLHTSHHKLAKWLTLSLIPGMDAFGFASDPYGDESLGEQFFWNYSLGGAFRQYTIRGDNVTLEPFYDYEAWPYGDEGPDLPYELRPAQPEREGTPKPYCRTTLIAAARLEPEEDGHELIVEVLDLRAEEEEYTDDPNGPDSFSRFDIIRTDPSGNFESVEAMPISTWNWGNPLADSDIDAANWARVELDLRPYGVTNDTWPTEGSYFPTYSWDREQERFSVMAVNTYDNDILPFDGEIDGTIYVTDLSVDPIETQTFDVFFDFDIDRIQSESDVDTEGYRAVVVGVSANWQSVDAYLTELQFGGSEEEGETITGVEVMLVLPDGSEQSVFSIEKEPGEDLFVDCKMVSAPELMKLQDHLYACRTNIWESGINDGRGQHLFKLGQWTCYAPDQIQNAKCPGTTRSSRVDMTCWNVPDDTEIIQWYKNNWSDFKKKSGQILSEEESAYWRNFVTELMTIDGDYDSEDVAAIRKEFTDKYLTTDPDKLLPLTQDGIPLRPDFMPPSTPPAVGTPSNGPRADIPIEQKDFPYSYTCTCVDYSDVELSLKAGQEAARLWKRDDVPRLANGWRVCKHILKVLNIKGEIREGDIPSDIPMPEET